MIEIEVIDGVLYQWDIGRKIKINSSDEVVSEVHFSLSSSDEVLNVEPKEKDGVIIADIPNVLLQSGQKIVVYIVNCSEESERTIYYRYLYVNERPKPSDYVYTETEVKTYDALEKRIEHLEELKFVTSVNGIKPDASGNVSMGVGGLNITDDGEGNVTVTTSGGVSITDDGNGNVIIA